MCVGGRGLLNKYEVKQRGKAEGGDFGPRGEFEAEEIHQGEIEREDTDKENDSKREGRSICQTQKKFLVKKDISGDAATSN